MKVMFMIEPIASSRLCVTRNDCITGINTGKVIARSEATKQSVK